MYIVTEREGLDLYRTSSLIEAKKICLQKYFKAINKKHESDTLRRSIIFCGNSTMSIFTIVKK